MAVVVGRLADKRIVRRGFKPLCAPGCQGEWLGRTGLGADNPARRPRFLQRARSRFAAWH